MHLLSWLIYLVAALIAAAPARADTGLICSGNPWIDVRCPYNGQPGALGNGTADDTASIQAVINGAVTNNWPVQFGPLTYKVTSQVTIDYAGQASKGFRLLAQGATLDGRTIASGPVLQVQCGGGTVGSPVACFYFHQEGTLFVLGNSGATNLATLTSAYSSGATTLNVSSTAPFLAGQTINIALASGGSFSTSIASTGAGTVTISPGLPSATNINAQVSRPSYPLAVGKVDFSDQHNSFKIDHISVNNAATAAGAGGCQFNAVYDSDIYAVCVSAGGAGGVALEQVQFSRISGAGSAAATGGQALVLENGFNFSNTFFALDLEVAPICLSITSNHDGQNTFISPYFNCATAVNAPASTRNVLINPNYGGLVTNRGPISNSIQIIGTGSRVPWQFPAVGSFSAAGVDSGTALSAYNAPGSSLTVTLPAPSSVEFGWWMGFATDNGKGVTLNPAAGAILAGGKSYASFSVGPGNYEYVEVVSDGNNYRLRTATRNTLAANGAVALSWPGNWLYPSTAGYAATLADNGNVLSSYNTSSGLAVTLPSTTNLPAGWSLGLATDQGKSLTVTVNGTSGGAILYPLPNPGGKTSLTLAGNNYELVVLQYDGSNFRIEHASPGTAQALNMAGIGGISRWSFPATSSYAATIADNGNAVSAYNSPAGFMTLTLPAATSLQPGWTIGVASDNGKATAVQVHAGDSARILSPGTLGAVTSLQLTTAYSGYELLVLQYDGSNFRVVGITPTSANTNGMTIPQGTVSSSSSPCQTGATQFDSNYLYMCTAPNTWKRTAWSSF